MKLFRFIGICLIYLCYLIRYIVIHSLIYKGNIMNRTFVLMALTFTAVMSLSACSDDNSKTTGEKVDQAISKTKDVAKDLSEKAKEASEKVKSAAIDASEKAQDIASEASEKVKEAAKDASKKAKEMASDAGSTIEEACEKAKEKLAVENTEC